MLRSADHATTEATLSSTLESLDGATNYRRWIFDLALPHLDGPVLEVGAGRGTFTSLLAERSAVHAVEPSKVLAAPLAAQYVDDPRVSVTVGTIDDLAAGPQFGSAVMFNVLEHIEDDAAVLQAIYSRLLPGGSLVLWVPAFDLLYSDFDEMLGHHRRYRLHPLVDLVTRCSFRIVDARYVNALGWFSWLVGARPLKRAPTSPGVISVFDRVAVPTVRAVERGVRPPFGQSIFLAARKPVG